MHHCFWHRVLPSFTETSSESIPLEHEPCMNAPSWLSGYVLHVNHWLGDALTNSDKDMMSSAPSGATGQSGHSGGSDQSGRSGGSGQSEHSKKSEQSGQSGSDGEGKSPQSGESQTRPAEFPDAVEDGVRPVGLQDPNHQVRQDPDHVRPVGLQVTSRRGYPAGPQDLNHQVRPAGLQDPNHVRPAGPQDPHHRVRPARPQDPNHQWRPAGLGDSSHRVRTVGPQGPNHRSPCLLNSYHKLAVWKETAVNIPILPMQIKCRRPSRGPAAPPHAIVFGGGWRSCWTQEICTRCTTSSSRRPCKTLMPRILGEVHGIN